MNLDQIIAESKRAAIDVQRDILAGMVKGNVQQVKIKIWDIVNKVEQSKDKHFAMSVGMYATKTSDLLVIERCPDDHTGDTYIFTKR